MSEFNYVVKISLLVLIFSGASLVVQAQDLTEGWAARQVLSREEARSENAFRHKINFFFGTYWNATRERLMAAKIEIKNLKASGKLARAKKLAESNEFRKMKIEDMKERAYITNEYGLFALEYVNEKGLENLDRREKIFVEKAIYRSLSGPVANRVGYKRLLMTPEGRKRLDTMLTKVMTDYQDITNQQDFFASMQLPKELRKLSGAEGEDSKKQRIASFCNVANKTFEKYAAKQKSIRASGVGSYGVSNENPNLVKMSCEEKRLVVYKMIASVSK